MQTLLVLYMVHHLLLPGHIEHVAGFDWLRAHGIYPRARAASRSPPRSSAPIPRLVYLTPILGGILADRLLGRTPHA